MNIACDALVASFWSITSLQIISGSIPKEKPFFCDSGVLLSLSWILLLVLSRAEVPCDLWHDFFLSFERDRNCMKCDITLG